MKRCVVITVIGAVTPPGERRADYVGDARLPPAPPSRWEQVWYQLRYRYAGLHSCVRRFLRWLFALGVKE